MSFESITQQTQAKYALRDTMKASPCAIEDWDFAVKLCYILCANTPFIGEYMPSEDQFRDIVTDGRKLFSRLMSQGMQSLSELEQKELACAAVFLTQRIDALRNSSEDDGQVWKDILSGLGYDELQPPPSWQSCYKKMTELIRANVPYFAEYGQKYYNTLRTQALTPADSISELFDIIYSFYRNNLHNLRIKQFQTGKIVADFCYMVLPKFSFQFSNPFFLNRSGEAGSVKISMSGSTIQQRFSLMENQTELDVSLGNQGLRCKLTVPKINITVDGENALYWPEHIWHKAIPQTTFIQIESPESISVRPMLGSLPLQHLKSKKIFDLGNQLATIVHKLFSRSASFFICKAKD